MQKIAFTRQGLEKNVHLPTLVHHALSFSDDFEGRGHQLGACHSHWCSPSL